MSTYKLTSSFSRSWFSSPEEAVGALVSYGVDKELVVEDDRIFVTNALLDVLKLEPGPDFDPLQPVWYGALEDILAYLLDDAVSRGVCEDGTASRDLFDTRIMGCITPPPSMVRYLFGKYRLFFGTKATDFLYKLAQDSDYIRTYRVRKNRTWASDTRYGKLDITINLSKPEKDPRAIAAARTKSGDSYPPCMLCRENEGYAGRLDYPARQTLRLVPVRLAWEQWFLQYSPYAYYPEHCIVLSKRHVPMSITSKTFIRLLDFVRTFPHYIIGSNADLPIVGGSILAHDHFQGGRYQFAMARAKVKRHIEFPDFTDVRAAIIDWPLSVIRLSSKRQSSLEVLGNRIFEAWRAYSDESVGVLAASGGEPHNTVTPIARRRSNREFELDIVLRNNRTSQEHPLGVFHPHAELHHIKRENIGLIEVMGLAVLPARLLDEMERLQEAIRAGEDVEGIPELASHVPWAHEILDRHPELVPGVDPEVVRQVLQDEIGQVFARVLEDCGVFKDDAAGNAAFVRFVRSMGGRELT